jgi:two-component system chemotaxis response regulator CheY
MKVLIADDCEMSRELLAMAFEGIARVEAAEDGEQAAQMFEAALAKGEPFDLICLDITMPKLSGHDVLRIIRSREEATGGRTVAFMITASSSPDDMLEGLLGSCDDYLTKPVMQQALRDLLAKHGLVS